MVKRIDSLKIDEPVTAKFHGSKQFGNDPSEMDLVFKRILGAGDDRRAVFAYDKDDDGDFEVYRYQGHWAYGASAEKFSIS